MDIYTHIDQTHPCPHCQDGRLPPPAAPPSPGTLPSPLPWCPHCPAGDQERAWDEVFRGTEGE